MKISKKNKKWVRDVIESLRHTLYITEWRIDIIYLDEDENGDMAWLLATIDADCRYFEATIRICPLFWTRPAEERVSVLCHELSHIHTRPFVDIISSVMDGTGMVSKREVMLVNERLTSIIERLVMRIHDS